MTVLVLGGTGEARSLADRLASHGVPVISSLAGVVSSPALPDGEVRVGGFGGVDGLVAFLRDRRVGRVVDATHPFAGQMTANAAAACALTGTPLLRLSRPGWEGHTDASGWHWVADLGEAKRVASELGGRVFLSVGRGSLADFTDWDDRYVLVRVIDEPPAAVPASWEIVRGRGPFDVAAETDLMRSRGIDVLVTKNSGGQQTAAKLDAAAALGVAVVMVGRPSDPDGVETVSSVDAALAWVLGG